MGGTLYRAKRVVRSPIVWWGRRRYADAPPAEREALERMVYRRKARELWGAGVLDPHALYRAELGDDNVIIDVGAFRGEVAETLLDLYGGQVHAFEPALAFYRDMAERFEGREQLHCYPYGLGKVDATLEMDVAGMGSTVHHRIDGVHGTETESVQIRDVASVLDELGLDRIDYIKINIEGGEFDLIDRLHESGWLERTHYLLIQFHEWFDGAERRRWRARRQLRQTHQQMWDYPWVYEQWCHKDRLPVQHTFTRDEKTAMLAALRAELEAKKAATEAS
jgi:FkbM family methyltransferase